MDIISLLRPDKTWNVAAGVPAGGLRRLCFAIYFKRFFPDRHLDAYTNLKWVMKTYAHIMHMWVHSEKKRETIP